MEHYLLGPKRGEYRRLDLAKLNERIHSLWKRELIDNISFRIEQLDLGLKLVVEVDERPMLTTIDYVGIKRVNRSDIIERIDRERINAYENQPLSRGEMRRLKGVVEEMYKEKGFRFAQVSFILEEAGTGQVKAIFTIDEGDKVKIDDIRFDGNTLYSDFRLRQAMKKTKQSGLLSKITKKDIYNPATLDEDMDLVKDLYRKAGYKDILVAKPEIDVVAKNPNAPTIKEQQRRLVITVPVEEGDRWRFGEVTIEGNDVFSDEVLLRQFEKPRGGWLRSKVVDEGVEKITNLYNSVGYIFSDIGSEYREKGDGGRDKVADLIVKISENDQFKVGRITFDGNEKTRDKVLRREMLVQEGTVMSMPGVQNSLLKIRQLNYFALNEEEPIKFDFNNEEKTVDLTVQGEEAARTELQFGGGWSELDGFFGQFAMRTTNFLGRGETMGISVQTGRTRDVFNLEYGIPWFLDRPQNVSFNVFQQSFDSRLLTGPNDIDFENEFSGASVTYGRRLRAFQSLSLTYSFSDIVDIRTAVDLDGEPIRQQFDFRRSSLRPFWIYNTVDSRFEPTRGLRLSASVELAGGFLGGESDFIRPILGLTWFKPTSRLPVKTSLGFNMQAGYIAGFEDENIFPQDFFFLGGENSVRGFRRRTIFVREEDGSIRRDLTGFPVGGDKSLQMNLEYHFILGGPFRTILYVDAGGVFASDQSVDPDLMRYSAGIELRILVPVFGAPLRFIYAKNLSPLPNDQFESFDFNIGTSF